MATWTNQHTQTVTTSSGSTVVTGSHTCYWSKLIINGTTVSVTIVGMDANYYLIDGTDGAAAPALASQLGLSYYMGADQYANQTSLRLYWTGSNWAERSSTKQTLMVIFCINPNNWGSL